MDEPYDAVSALETPESVGLRGVKDIAFGSVAGMASKVFEHPFDLCKVRLQAQVLEEVQRFKGPVDCLTQTWQSEGIRGLYRGLPLPLFGAILENAALFMTYNQLQIGIKKITGRSGDLSLGEKAIAAAGGGTVASFILTPLELIKCKMQVQMMAAEAKRLAAHSSEPLPPIDRRLLPGPLALVKEVLRTDGVRGLWLGQTGTFLREAGGAVAWFGTKEYVAKLLLRQHTKPSPDALPPTSKDLAIWESALAGAAAGIAYNIAMFPADSVKSTLQTELELRGGRAGPKSTFFGTFVALWRARGLKGLYAGCGVTVARAIPSSAMIFVIYDTLDRTFG